MLGLILSSLRLADWNQTKLCQWNNYLSESMFLYTVFSLKDQNWKIKIRMNINWHWNKHEKFYKHRKSQCRLWGAWEKRKFNKDKKMEDLRKVLRSHSDNFLHRMKVYSVYK